MKKKLPYYDRFPLILPIETYSNGFLGINFHYLSMPIRIRLLDRVMNFATNKKLDDTTFINADYRRLKRVKEIKPCLKRYLNSNVRSRFRKIKADLKVGKNILNETFSSHVSYHKESDKIIVTNLDGPLKHLKNEWHFKEINNNTQLEFFIDFELKNPILNGIMKKSFELGLNKIAKAFEERAIKLYK